MLLQVKYKERLQEDEKSNTDNWNDHFYKLKAIYEEEEESNDIDNLLKYADKQSQVPLHNDEISVLKLGLSFTLTPPQNIPDLEYDLYQFSRTRRLTYHFRNSISKPFLL